MREAALEIARIGDHYPFSAPERLFRAVRQAFVAAFRRREPQPTPFASTDPHRLADLGLGAGPRPAPEARAAVEERWARL